MLVGILKPFRGTTRSMLDVYKNILTYNKIDYIDLDINDADFWDKIKKIDAFLAKIAQTDDDLALAAQIIPIISHFLKIPCFPDFPTIWHYDDKIKQYYLLKSFGFPVVDSYIFWDKVKAIEWAKNTTYPVVFKLKGGAGSSNVKLVKSQQEAIHLIKKLFGKGIHPYYFDIYGKIKAMNFNYLKILKYFTNPIRNRLLLKTQGCKNYTKQRNYAYFQRYYKNNTYDTRICIVGARAFAFKRFVRKNDFRASGSNCYDMNRSHIDMEFVKIGFAISKRFNFQSMAYDFIYDDNKCPILIEMSYTYGDYPEFSTGFWDENLIWHDGKYVPEYFELVDTLKLPGLILPEIELNSPYKKAKLIN